MAKKELAVPHFSCAVSVPTLYAASTSLGIVILHIRAHKQIVLN